MNNYDHSSVEPKWQKHWLENKTFKATEDVDKESFYALDMFPFPSGAGLHVGHPVGYIATDILSRKRRMDGFNVLHPMGWDAFGLPAENYAIKTGVHPSIATRDNINNFRKQIQSLGMSYDWDREIDTTNPQYYKWTQWLFLQMYKQGLLYEKEKPMNWCPKCRVVCANEEVEQGMHERCNTAVESRNLRQWMFEITKYADRLLDDLDTSNFYLLHGWGGTARSGWFEGIQDFMTEKKMAHKELNFPDTEAPNYEAWKAYFEKEVPNLWKQDVVLGHSLGCTFMLRYLSEEDIKIDNLILVAPACYECADIDEIKNFFDTNFDYERIKASANYITIIGSDNDEYISEESFELLAEELDANLMIFPNRGHFSLGEDTDFPEVEAIFTELEQDVLDWPDKIKAMQRNWVGKSEGADVDFKVVGMDKVLTVYTTRIDTIFSGTFLIMAPEHPWLEKFVTPENKEAIAVYQKRCAAMTDVDRTEINQEKTGVFTGSYAINPASGEEMPIWISDFVLASYGTGVVFADVHDERDFELAKKYNIPLKVSLLPIEKDKREAVENMEECFSGEGVLINSLQFDGLISAEARPAIIDWLNEEKGAARRKTNYKLRDWIFTRQRYWGEPIPLVFDEDGECYPLDESELPLILPETPNYEPSANGESPLAKITDWVNVEGYITDHGSVVISDNAPEGVELQKFRRETSTMPNWAGSNWYWLRFMDARNDEEFVSFEAEDMWGPVDLYVGGAEHAVLHLLYSRFWHKVLYDMGLVHTKEPFKKLVNQGLIMAEDGSKMSKSLGNVVNPDEIVEKYGADTLRCYEMFMGPFEQSKQWNTDALAGMRKFLDRIWRLFEKPLIDTIPESTQKATHSTVKKVTEDIEGFRFNTALSQLMIFVNEASKWEELPKESMQKIVKVLSPFAPHLAEEIWKEKLGEPETLTYADWPTYDESFLVEDTVTYAVQVNGKLRADFEAAADASKDDVIATAKGLEKVAKYLEEGEIRKEIFVPGKIVGFVTDAPRA